MCGIAGLISPRRFDPDLVKAMTDPIAHRGPDDEGVWIDQDAGVGLGHRRLSIVDLSPLGHQPMASHSGRYVIVYNGEIYNHHELRAELDAPWRGHSDTEVLLAAIDRWGLDQALTRCVGMFAIALWDKQDRVLHLARDRFGEKPLYYGHVGGDFVFASELKSLKVHPKFDNPINREALAAYASRLYVPAPLVIIDNLFKLEPGCILTVSNRGAKLESRPYWSYRDVVAAGLADPITDEAEALAELEAALSTSIRGQMVADVPVGAFLSGGIDSSTVVGLYQKHSPTPIRTYTIGFEEQGFDEAPYARAVARHFGTEHHEQYVTARDAQDVLPLLPAMYDEPFADSSQIPTHLVSRFARGEVKVALSGDGGDELFGGYNRYFATARLWSNMQRLPRPVRSAIGNGLGRLPPSTWNGVGRVMLGSKQPLHFGAKVQKALRIMGTADDLQSTFTGITDEWFGEPSPVLRQDGRPSAAFDLDAGPNAPDPVRMMYCDAMSYLPDDILCKVDRAAMAVSLETRVPFLDHRVAEVAARIPLAMKIAPGRGKLILRKLLYGMAPQELFERPKAGFGMPVGQWMRGSLRPWAESLLDEGRLRSEGYFDAAQIRRRWDDHLHGRRDVAFSLWGILMFQAWLDEWNKAPSAAPKAAPAPRRTAARA